jgi:hypothetical protein
MLTIYRVETAEGRGPYVNGTTDLWTDDPYLFDGPTWPHPCQDTPPLPLRYGEDFCGFHSQAQFACWFDEDVADHARMRAAGFAVSVYQVDCADTKMARYQCLFKRELAHKTDTIDIVDFFARGTGLPEVEPDDQGYVSMLTVPNVALAVDAAQRGA